jgi:hypothetical protein
LTSLIQPLLFVNRVTNWNDAALLMGFAMLSPVIVDAVSCQAHGLSSMRSGVLRIGRVATDAIQACKTVTAHSFPLIFAVRRWGCDA